MSKQDRVMQIFLAECKEILDAVEPELLYLEEHPDDKNIINELFRGVHTLKGNANSFGFVKLGGFVHYFEDLLDLYRKPDGVLTKDRVDLFLRAFDIVKNVFENEELGIDEYPQNYHVILDEIKIALAVKDEASEAPKTLDNIVTLSNFEHIEHNDLSELAIVIKNSNKDLFAEISSGKSLYNVIMNFDNDIYLRGYNHQIFFRLFKDVGEVVYTFFELSKNTPALDDFETEHSFIKTVSVYLLSNASMLEIEDIFEFIAQDDEIAISSIAADEIKQTIEKESAKVVEVASQKETEKVIKNDSDAKAPSESKVASSIRVESAKIDELFDSIGELVIAQSYISQNEQIKAINNKEVNQYLEMLGKSTRIIQNKVMSLRMIPIRDTFLKMKRVVRDVSKKTGKEIELILSGEETEIDKTMVDKLSEPLIHLLRNSVDHGIEATAEERIDAGKEGVGNVWLSAAHKGSTFVIEIKDDGRGIDTKKILAKAIEKGLANSHTEYSDDEIVSFLFAAGFSTAENITDVSGRGVGLDAVRTSIEELRGKVTVETELGKGSTFRIILPLTLAIIDGLTVRVEDETYIIPTLTVIESFRAGANEVQKAQGKGEFINFRGDILPVLRLNNLLSDSTSKIPYDESTLICVEHERGRYVLQVNELLGRQQVVIKTLGKLMRNVKEISGAAILGSGHIALILNTEGLRDYLDNGLN